MSSRKGLSDEDMENGGASCRKVEVTTWNQVVPSFIAYLLYDAFPSGNKDYLGRVL